MNIQYQTPTSIIRADVFSIITISLFILFASKNNLLMSVVVPGIIFLRLFFSPNRRHKKMWGTEVIFFIICVLVGGFNDWRSVFVKKIYDYHVPVIFPEISTIPLWMILYWGTILSFMSHFASWEKIREEINIEDSVRLGWYKWNSSGLKVGLEMALILFTRQFIYQYYRHPQLSWIPFLVALIIYFLLFGLSYHDLKIVGLAIVIGTFIEAIYINYADLHYYHIGFIFGVPVWITLWWGLGLLIWKDLSLRLKILLLKP